MGKETESIAAENIAIKTINAKAEFHDTRKDCKYRLGADRDETVILMINECN